MQAVIPIKKRRPMPTFGIYDGGPNAEAFVKVGERVAADHDKALEALDALAYEGHIYAICGSPVAGQPSTMVFRRAHTEIVQRVEVRSERLETFRTLTDEAIRPSFGASDPAGPFANHIHVPLTRPFGH